MNEKEQAGELYQELQTLRVRYSDYIPLWEAVGDCAEAVAKRHRALSIREKKDANEAANGA